MDYELFQDKLLSKINLIIRLQLTDYCVTYLSVKLILLEVKFDIIKRVI